MADWYAHVPLAWGRNLEVRSDLSGGRIARVLFSIQRNEMYLLNGFIKKTQKTPLQEIELARQRLREIAQ